VRKDFLGGESTTNMSSAKKLPRNLLGGESKEYVLHTDGRDEGKFVDSFSDAVA
jgi:hypothetical protein